MHFIQLTENLRINLDQVVAIEYFPAYRPGVDDDPSDAKPARLLVRTTDLLGGSSWYYKVTGRDAEIAWKNLGNITDGTVKEREV